jgi:glycosyltransferase involved in cell wall biosynthesis
LDNSNLHSPHISVAICTWNRCDSLRITLEHFTRIRIPEGIRWELLLVNNNCTDSTDDTAKAFEERLPIRLLHERVPGTGRSRNLAIREANGKFLFWTDDDVIPDSGWMAHLWETMIGFEADWAFGRSIPTWPAAVPKWYSDRVKGYVAALDYGSEPFIVKSHDYPFYNLNLAGTMEAHRRLGGYREDSGFIGEVGGFSEDMDLFERALQNEMKIVYTPRAVIYHVIPEKRTLPKFHRRRQWLANGVFFAHLGELYPDCAMLLGMPRFFFLKAAADSRRYLISAVKGDAQSTFYYEMQLLRFLRLLLSGITRLIRPAAAVQNTKKREKK